MLLLVLSTLNCGGGGGGSSAAAAPPTITAITPSGTAGIGSTMTLVATASDPANLALTYSWNFGDGSQPDDTGATVSHVYSAAGTYTVTLTTTNSGGASSTRTLSLAISSSKVSADVTADCSGTNCAATTSGANNSYSGSGTGVWRFDNLTNAAVTRDINIQDLKGDMTVTLVFSNGENIKDAPTTPSFGALAAPGLTSASSPSAIPVQSKGSQQISERAAGEAQHTQLLHANRAVAMDLIQMAAQPKPSPASPAGVALESGTNLPLSTPSPVEVYDVRQWNENAFTHKDYNTTAKVVCVARTLGRKVVIWVDNTNMDVSLYQEKFCDTNNNYGQYAKIANLLGDAWGPVPTPAFYAASSIISDTPAKQDINIVIVDPGADAKWGGYFYSLNNVLKKTALAYTNSNEALVFFVNSRQDPNYIVSVLIHELTHMINFYQRTILHYDRHETWLEETSAMMTQDIFDAGLPLSGGCLPIVCEVYDFAKSGAGISYFNWPSSISSVYYNLGASFAAFLNRRYGPVIYAQLMTDCYTPTTQTTSFACLDFLIKKNGGVGFADDFAKMGASVFGLLGGTEPSQYGFPAKSGTVAKGVDNLITSSYTYALPAFNDWWKTPSTITIPTASGLITYPYTSQTYKIDTVAAGKTSYVRTGVSVPAKTSLIIVIK